MASNNITKQMLERITKFVEAIDNGEYTPSGYEFTVKVLANGKFISIEENFLKQNQ